MQCLAILNLVNCLQIRQIKTVAKFSRYTVRYAMERTSSRIATIVHAVLERDGLGVVGHVLHAVCVHEPLFNLPILALKARHLDGSAFCWIRIV